MAHERTLSRSHTISIAQVLIEVDKFALVNMQVHPFSGIHFGLFTRHYLGNRAGAKPSLEGMKAGFCEKAKERGACFTHLSFERERKRGEKVHCRAGKLQEIEKAIPCTKLRQAHSKNSFSSIDILSISLYFSPRLLQ